MTEVKVSERVEASADQVWELFRDFGGVQRFTPALEKCEVEGEGIGAVRTLGLPGGVALQERLEAFDDAARTFSYSIVSGPVPFENYLATVMVRPDGEACVVDWSSTFEPGGLPEDQARSMVEGIYTSGLAGIRGALGL